MLELSLNTSFTTFCSRGTHCGTSSAATLWAENINSTSLLEIEGNNIIKSGSAFKNLGKLRVDRYVHFSGPIFVCEIH